MTDRPPPKPVLLLENGVGVGGRCRSQGRTGGGKSVGARDDGYVHDVILLWFGRRAEAVIKIVVVDWMVVWRIEGELVIARNCFCGEDR